MVDNPKINFGKELDALTKLLEKGAHFTYMCEQPDRYKLNYEVFDAVDDESISDEMLSWYSESLRENSPWFPCPMIKMKLLVLYRTY